MSTWADGYGVWYVRVLTDGPSPRQAAVDALRAEIEPRETHAHPDVWLQPARVPDLDTDHTMVYREGTPPD